MQILPKKQMALCWTPVSSVSVSGRIMFVKHSYCFSTILGWHDRCFIKYVRHFGQEIMQAICITAFFKITFLEVLVTVSTKLIVTCV